MTLRSYYEKYKTGLTFMFFGLLTTIVDYVVYILLSFLFGRETMMDEGVYLIVNAISSFVAITFAYFTNKLYVFKSKSWHWSVLLKEIPSFYSSRIVALIVSEIGIWVLVRFCGLNHFTTEDPLFTVFGYAITGDIIAKFIMSFVSTALNYIFCKFLIFRDKKKNKKTIQE